MSDVGSRISKDYHLLFIFCMICLRNVRFAEHFFADEETRNTPAFYVPRVIKTQDAANLSLLSFGEVFALLFDNHFLYVIDLRTEAISGRWPLPAYRKSKRGSSFLAGVTSWLNGLDGNNDSGLVFATSMPDHSIHLVLWKENG